jgi:hypothetical protein
MGLKPNRRSIAALLAACLSAIAVSATAADAAASNANAVANGGADADSVFPLHEPQLVATKPSTYSPVTAMWRGASLYGTGRPVSVYFIRSIADWGNQLFQVDPATGREKSLMLFRDTQQAFHCPDSGGLVADLGMRDSSDEIVFNLRTLSASYAGKYCTGEACGPRYSGLNDPARSRYYSRGEYAHMANFVWTQSARLTPAQVDSIPAACTSMARMLPGEGGILMSYNDGANDTYGDLLFLVTGVEMDVERFAPPIGPDPDTSDALPLAAECRIDAGAGGVTKGEAFQPRAMALPVSAILPRRSSTRSRMFMDQDWRLMDPARPDETQFPNGPDILVTAPGPFEFNLGFFTNQGGLVNRAKGRVTAAMLAHIPPGPDGRRSISLMWYPVSSAGQIASTGAYVVKGTLRTLPAGSSSDPASGRPASCPEVKADLLSSFGYIRY